MIIDQHTDLYGVVGYPLGHTLSPAMHNAAFLASGVNAVYLAFETGDIDQSLRGMKALGIRGMSVTIPHKSAVIPLLDEVDDLAKRIGAVNTIVNSEGRLAGYNSDAVGALNALEDQTELSGKTGLIIGAGGAARAIGFILKERGVHLTIANRSTGRGEALAGTLGCPFLPLEEIKDIQADLLIQTTPVGMVPHHEQCIISPDALKEGMVVMDIIYNPLETRLLTMARTQGCLTINGLPMFIHQGAEQFRLWTGIEAPISAMTHAVKQALNTEK
ncbi:MAG: shikimate dehydrogenase [Desulfatiglandales bacterium]